MRFHPILTGLCCLLAGTSAFGGGRFDFPQISAEVNLRPEEVESIFLPAGNSGRLLSAREAQPLFNALPRDFSRGCHDMLPDYGPEAEVRATWAWSVRLLHAEKGGFGQSALLALRCTGHVPGIADTYSDERLAVLLSGQKTVLKLLALDKDCLNCEDLYHFEFVQRFQAENDYFAELTMAYTTENPFCDGGDIGKGARFVLVAIPSGAVALTFDKETYFNNHDDEDGDTETVCKSVVTYEREGASLLGVKARMACTENGKQNPPITVTQYRWNGAKGRFERNAAASTQNP